MIPRTPMLRFIGVLAVMVFTACQGEPTVPSQPDPPGGISFLTIAPNTFTQVSAGAAHSCALRDDGVVECWGDDSDGGAPATRAAPSGKSYTQVSATGRGAGGSTGGTYSCALRDDGVVECWGDNFNGQAPATKAAANGTFTQVSAGFGHSCALRSDGVVECWGTAPGTTAAASGTFTQVSAGYGHNCALRGDGVVECWGDNSNGQAPATKAAGSGTFTQVSTVGLHSCALRDDGVVECWGDNGSGQAPATQPAPSGTIFTQVSAGGTHSCALRSDGVAECWGDNGSGQAPATRAASSGTFTQVSAGVLPHSCALRSDGVVECWGDNSFGQAPAIREPSTTVHEYDFGGFVGSVDAPPTFNAAKAGSAVAVKFSLGGDQGLAILAAGYPKSQPIGCDATSPVDPIEETVTAGSSSLSYDANTDFYTYVWKTVKTWARSCRLLTIRLADGNDYTALFQF